MNTLIKSFLFIGALILNTIVLAQTNKETLENYIENGDYLAAHKLSNELLVKDSTNSSLWFENGKIKRNLHWYNEAAYSFKRAIEIDTNKVKYQLALAKTYHLSGQSNQAVKTYKSILEKEPENIAALTNLAIYYKKGKQNNEAFLLYERLHYLDTLNSEYLLKMATCKIKMKKMEEGFFLLKKAYKVGEENINVVLLLGNIYINSKKYDTALSIIDKTINIYPTEPELYSLRGYANYRRNHHFRSIPDYQKALELGSISTKVKKNLGASLFAVKRYQEAKEVLEQLLFPDTVDANVCIYLGNIYNMLGDPDKGIVFFNKSLEIQEPEELSMSSTYRGLQACYQKKGQHYKAIEMIKLRQEVLKNRFFSNQYLLEIAEVFEVNLKDKSKALKYYKKYYGHIKDAEWYSEESKNKLEAKINRLKEDIHFEQ